MFVVYVFVGLPISTNLEVWSYVLARCGSFRARERKRAERMLRLEDGGGEMKAAPRGSANLFFFIFQRKSMILRIFPKILHKVSRLSQVVFERT